MGRQKSCVQNTTHLRRRAVHTRTQPENTNASHQPGQVISTVPGKTDQWQSDLFMQKLCESEIVRIKSQVKRMGEFIPVSKDDNEVTTHFWRQVMEVHVLIARRDGSGIRIFSHGRLLNFGGHCPAGTSSLISSKKVAGFRSRKWRFPVKTDRSVHSTPHT